ncbi:MAG: acyl-CoA dehydrogenase family protein [Pseudomonadota bacterium]|nr:acyl-CoA dehydrogenase family protein [Pseudomonadota bacterium]
MNDLFEPFHRLLEQLSTPETIRQAEAGDHGSGWQILCESGFLDALVPEARGGAGLAPAEVAPLFISCGHFLVPYGVAETVVARALVASAGESLPDGPVVLWPEDHAGRLRSVIAPALGGATHALIQRGSRACVKPLSHASAGVDGYHIIQAAIDGDAAPLFEFDLAADQLMNWAATLVSASMAGAMSRVLAMTLEHVNHRQQFDRPLARFQAVQQQISVMAERVAAANVAARAALMRDLPGPDTLDAAVAKTINDSAATLVANTAHAAHGAIGITAEHDLSLYVRRLKRWQLSFGSATHWSNIIGARRLAYTAGNSVDFLREPRR